MPITDTRTRNNSPKTGIIEQTQIDFEVISIA
jgi:hypothetical protein